MSRLALIGIVVAASLAGVPAPAEDWWQWRGPRGDGVSPDGDPPLHWSEGNGVLFKVPIDGDGLASPVVWGDQVFVLSAEVLDEETYAEHKRIGRELGKEVWPPKVEPVEARFIVTSFSRHDGSRLWQRTASQHQPHESHYIDSSWAGASPLTDGERVYAHFGSNGTFAFGMAGEPLWQLDLGDMTTRTGFGEGSSPALAGHLLIINWDHEGNSFIVAIDGRSGKEAWRASRPDEPTSWSTPLVLENDRRTEVVVASSGRIRSYDPATGRELWSHEGLGTNVIPTPTHRDGVVYLASGKRDSNRLLALELSDSAGPPAVLWSRDRDTPYVATPLLYRDQLYFFKHTKAILTSVDAASGQTHFTARVPGMRNVYASPVAAAGRIYLFGRDGETVVLRHGRELDVLATNHLDDGFDASPAIVGDVMYLRGRQFLYAVARRD